MTRKELKQNLFKQWDKLFAEHEKQREEYYDYLSKYGADHALTINALCNMNETMGKITIMSDFVSLIDLLEDVK